MESVVQNDIAQKVVLMLGDFAPRFVSQPKVSVKICNFFGFQLYGLLDHWTTVANYSSVQTC
jgi:hypothetical protein